MPTVNKKSKIAPVKINKKAKKVDEDIEIDPEDLVDEVPDPKVLHEELDPEILKALNVKIPKNQQKDIDYIPELERGEFDLED